MSPEQQQLQAAIAALEAQRPLLGDSVVESLLAPARARLALLGSGAADLPTQALRQVTILCLDVVGSTTLSQHLDPEQIHAVLDDALARCTRIVEAHRGKVLQYAGDNLLGVFGADEVSEDDAERAVRSGLALLAEGRALGAEVVAAHGHAGFDVRVGIHTGSVLLGGGVDAEGTIRGIAVNLAARLEQAAPAGTLRISQDAYNQVRGMFEVLPQAPIHVKGIDEPVRSLLVLRAKPRSFRIVARGIEGVETRMVGRAAELLGLQQAFARVVAERRLVQLCIVGEAGLGKSRLLHEFEVWSEARPERFYLFRGRAHPQTEGQPYGLLRDILAWRLQIGDDDTLEVAKAKLEEAVAAPFVADEGAGAAEARAHLLGHLIGLDYAASRHVAGILHDPRQIRDRAFHTAAQWFSRLSASDGSPIVVELEDLHWADAGSLDFLSHLAQANRDVPMLVIGLTRPALFERRPDWMGAAAVDRRIDLQPLDQGASEALFDEMLRKLVTVPAALQELVVGRAEGNPFYMEELVKMLVDQGALQTDTERWTLDSEKLLSTTVPTTLNGVLQARLDSLPAAEKRVLQEASVIGYVFWDRALAALDSQADALLPALIERALALPRPDATTPEGLREYSFSQQMLHTVTYRTVLRRTREKLHGQVARWLAALIGARENDFLALTAQHFEAAGDAGQAAEYHARAAVHAKGRFAHDAAIAHAERGLALLKTVDGERDEVLKLRWRLLDVREQGHDMHGRRSAERLDIEALDAVAEALDDDRRRAHVAWRRSYLAMRIADWPTSESAARAAMALAERAGDDALRLRAQQRLAGALGRLGREADGVALAQQGLAEARDLGLLFHEALFLNTLIVIAGQTDDLVGCLRLNQQELEIDRGMGNRHGEAVVRGNLGASWLGLGELARARVDLDESIRLTRSMGDRAIECGPVCNLSLLELCEGNAQRAAEFARSAIDTAVSVGSRNWEALARLHLADAELLRGRLAEAALSFREAHACAKTIGDPSQYFATTGLARVALASSDAQAAWACLQQVISQMDDGGALAHADRGLIELTVYRVLVQLGELQEATAWLERAHTSLLARAAKIEDEQLRVCYMNNIPWQRDIVAAWRASEVAKGAG